MYHSIKIGISSFTISPFVTVTNSNIIFEAFIRLKSAKITIYQIFLFHLTAAILFYKNAPPPEGCNFLGHFKKS